MSRRTNTTNETATLRAAGLPEIGAAATVAAAAAASDIGNTATQQTKRKPQIVSVEQVGQSYEVTYDSGTTKKMIICKAPKTVLSWLEAHAAEEPETTMEIAADPETETTMEMEPVKVEALDASERVMESEPPTPFEPDNMESPDVTPSEPETTPERSEPAEPVRTTEAVRKPHRDPQPGLWLNPLQIGILIIIRIAQFGIIAALLSVQAILAMMRAAAVIQNTAPVVIQNVRAGYLAMAAETVKAAQTFTEAAGAARRYWTEVYIDMRRDVPQVVRVSNKTLLRLGQTVLSTIR